MIEGGGDDFKEMKARMDKSREFKQVKRNEHVLGLIEKEKGKIANFMSNLGVDVTALQQSGQRIQIAPRNDDISQNK